MSDALSTAYENLIKVIAKQQFDKRITPEDCTCLWPDSSALVTRDWSILITSVYAKIILSTANVICCNRTWLRLKDCKIIDQGTVNIPYTEEVLLQCGHQVLTLSGSVMEELRKSDAWKNISSCLVSEQSFFQDTFFPNIKKFSALKRDTILCHLLDQILQAGPYIKLQFESFIKGKSCIPCSTFVQLKDPAMLIDPTSDAAGIFSIYDYRFPCGNEYKQETRLLVLRSLGMKSKLNWDDICERAKSISLLSVRNHDSRVKRTILLLEYIEKNFNHLGSITLFQKSTLQQTKFLPVLKKPQEYCLPWKGQNESQTLVSAKESVLSKHMYLVGCTWPLVDESTLKIKPEIETILGFPELRVKDVLHQLAECRKACEISNSNMECITRVCKKVYSFLQDKICSKDSFLEDLKKQPCILVKGRFLYPSQVAFNFTKYSACILYKVPDDFHDYRTLFEHIGVKDEFSITDFVGALKKMKKEKKNDPLNVSELETAKGFIEELCMDDADQDELVYLPNEKSVLFAAKELAIHDAPWITKQDPTKYVHRETPSTFAYKLGAYTIREVYRLAVPFGIPFGQKETLVDRLRGILRDYPCDVEILKELLQNADDAKASSIHFIHDTRQLPHEKVFSDKWQEVLGPALCVLNDASFTEKDIQGIQRIGVGGKADDPTKTGQFGIGFNAVYHLTDIPQLLSNNETLCIFDPLLHYIPGANSECPGRQFGPLDKKFKNEFSDVLNAFLESYFDLSNTTMFRFPLRTKKQAQSADISRECFEEQEMSKLLESFKEEAKRMLFFLNHVRKIIIWKISPNGNKKQLYEVSVNLEPENETKRNQFADFMSKSKSLPTSRVPYSECTYPMKLSDSHCQETWLVSRCIGVRDEQSEHGVDGSKMGLIPHGGIAARLSNKSQEFNGSMFCTLPLPVRTGLPVHVNGHFVLDHARREIWQDESKCGDRSQWNSFIKTQILGQAYTNLLEAAKKFIFSSVFERSKNTAHTEMYYTFTKLLKYKLDIFNGLLPRESDARDDWKCLVGMVYKSISRSSILPVILKEKDQKGMKLPKKTSVCRFIRPEEGYFFHVQEDTTSKTKSQVELSEGYMLPPTIKAAHLELKEILVDIGMAIVESPEQIYTNFKKFDVKVATASSSAVVKFLKSYNQPNSPCRLGNIPFSLKKSTIRTEERFMGLFKHCINPSYLCLECSKCPECLESWKCLNCPKCLNGLPLLLTQDQKLQVYDSDYPILLSDDPFHQLLPHHANMFQNVKVTKYLTSCHIGYDLHTLSVFKRFDTSELAPFIGTYLRGRLFKPVTGYISWNPTDDNVPTAKWMELFWRFFYFCLKNNRHPSLDPFIDWAIVPVYNNRLITPREAHRVMNLHRADAPKQAPQLQRIARILQKLDCPKLDFTQILHDESMVDDINPILEKFVSHPSSPQQVLKIIAQINVEDKDAFNNRLSEEDVDQLLMFFQENKDCSVDILKNLPLYKNILEDGFIQIGNCDTFVITDTIPHAELDVLMKLNGIEFLAFSPKLEEIYMRLGVQKMTIVSFYTKVVFPSFRRLKFESTVEFLKDIRDKVLPTLKIKNEEYESFCMSLQSLQFIPIPDSINGEFQPACACVDPNVPLLVLMYPDGVPPDPFCKEEWLPFLEECGLRTQPSENELVTFAKQIAESASNEKYSNSKELAEKSKVFVKYLLEVSTERNYEQSFFTEISKIKCVAPSKVDGKLEKLYPYKHCSFTAFNAAVSHKYESISWTCGTVLPEWINNLASCDEKRSRKKSRLAALGVLHKPSVKIVCSNIERICQKYKKNNLQRLVTTLRAKLNKVLKKAYMFLENELQCDDPDCTEHEDCFTVETSLYDKDCILLENMFIRGTDVVFELVDEIPSYLHKVPSTLVQFRKFLKHLGAEEKATPSHYAQVLQKIKNECKDENLHPNEKDCCKKAVCGLFNILLQAKTTGEETESLFLLSETKVLFLPTTKFNNLKPSRDLVFNDFTGHTSRVKEMLDDHLVNFNEECFTKSIQTSSKEIIKLLPDHLKPKHLSIIIKQVLLPKCAEETCYVQDSCVTLLSLEKVLKSRYFVNGILWLLKHERKGCLPEDFRQRVISVLDCMTIVCLNNLITQFVYISNGMPVKQSDHEDWFHGEEDESGTVHLFFKHGQLRLIERSIAEFLANLFHTKLTTCLGFLLATKNPDRIPEILDMKGIKEDKEDEEDVEACEGKEIPNYWHHLLMHDITYTFTSGEIVGIEWQEESGDFIYGRVVCEVESEIDSPLAARYLIHIGESEVEFGVLDMYKFDRAESDDDQEDEIEAITALELHSGLNSNACRKPSSLEDLEKVMTDFPKRDKTIKEA